MADDVSVNPAQNTNIFISSSPQLETKAKVSSGNRNVYIFIYVYTQQ